MFDSFDEWLKFGFNKGWCGPDVCDTHDGLPMSEQESAAFWDGGDPCIHIIRLYSDVVNKGLVEDAHSPSVWRASNLGL